MIRNRYSDVPSSISVSSRLSDLRLNRTLSYQSVPNPAKIDGYDLVKVDTNFSLDSAYLEAPTYKIKLSLTQDEIGLLRYTWNKMLMDEPLSMDSLIPGGFRAHTDVSTNSSIVASSLFCKQLYSTLLGMAPTLVNEFPSIHHQAGAFAGVMSMTISQLENLETIENYLRNLGKRHSRILNIEPAQFELLGECLIITFHERFGLKFTQELEVLWIKLFMYLANSMIQFGIDPHIRTIEGYDEPLAEPQQESIDSSTLPSSILSAVPSPKSSLKSVSSNDSIMDDSILGFYRRESLAHDSIDTSVDGISVNLKSKFKKRKQDCVIV